jgi:hypothetical protein
MRFLKFAASISLHSTDHIIFVVETSVSFEVRSEFLNILFLNLRPQEVNREVQSSCLTSERRKNVGFEHWSLYTGLHRPDNGPGLFVFYDGM